MPVLCLVSILKKEDGVIFLCCWGRGVNGGLGWEDDRSNYKEKDWWFISMSPIFPWPSLNGSRQLNGASANWEISGVVVIVLAVLAFHKTHNGPHQYLSHSSNLQVTSNCSWDLMNMDHLTRYPGLSPI